MDISPHDGSTDPITFETDVHIIAFGQRIASFMAQFCAITVNVHQHTVDGPFLPAILGGIVGIVAFCPPEAEDKPAPYQWNCCADNDCEYGHDQQRPPLKHLLDDFANDFGDFFKVFGVTVAARGVCRSACLINCDLCVGTA